MKRAGMIAVAVAMAAIASGAVRQQHAVYQDPSAAVEKRVDDLFARMTLEEKIRLLGGDRASGFATQPVERLGIPSMTMTDGPVGVRWEKSTAFPAGVAMAASWDPDLVARIGGAIAAEARAHGRDVLLGPCVNIQRVPQGGRNFESFGEDPYLASRMAVAFVQGVQHRGVIATPKHFAANNQETGRMVVDARVDERTLHEIYLPAFRAAVQEAGARAVMSAYNKLNGAWCSENPVLLNDLLKRDWGFKGLVMSDWGAVHSTVATAMAGCDLEMPRGEHLNANQLLPAVDKGEVPTKVVDDKVRRILRVMIATGVYDRHGQPAADGALDTPAHRDLARQAAIDAAVLLKNDGALLPLDAAVVKAIAVIGPNAAIARTGGGGSSRVTPFYSVSPLEGIQKRVGSTARIVYAAGCAMRGDPSPLDTKYLTPAGGPPGAHGLAGEYFANPDLQGTPAATRVDDRLDLSLGRRPGGGRATALPEGIKAENFSVRWTGTITLDKTAQYQIAVRADEGVRVFIDGRLLIDGWTAMRPTGEDATVTLEAAHPYPIEIDYFQKGGPASLRIDWRIADAELAREAVAAARQSDVAVVFAGLSAAYESEGADRESLTLPENQEQLIRAVAAANRRTVVVLNSGAPVVMETWVDQVPALLEAWYPGQEAGNAAAALLFGDRAPSGKLPVTFLKRWEDSPAYGHYPGQNETEDYAEGVFVGYRHFDRAAIEPRFPFGHGLSYTTFTYQDLSVTLEPRASDPGPLTDGQQADVRLRPAIRVAFEVRNDGPRPGADVAQVYVSPARATVDRPPKELKAFRKIPLAPGERRRVEVTLDRDALAFYDATRHAWTVQPGRYEILVGSSSRLIRLRTTLLVK